MATTSLIPSSFLANNVTVDNGTTIISGWVQGSQGRGTLDIIWGCALTEFLCTWTAIYLNIPHLNYSKTQKLLRKAKWMAWAIAGPEVVLFVALGQYASARRSVTRFARLGHSHWTLYYGFFADMGGIVFATWGQHAVPRQCASAGIFGSAPLSRVPTGLRRRHIG